MQNHFQYAAHSFCYSHKWARSNAATSSILTMYCLLICSACGSAGVASHSEHASDPLLILQSTFLFLFLILRFHDWNDWNVFQCSLFWSPFVFAETVIPCPALSGWHQHPFWAKFRSKGCLRIPLNLFMGTIGKTNWNNFFFFLLCFEAYYLARVMRPSCGLDNILFQYSG